MKLSTIYVGVLVVEGYDDTRIQDLEDDKLENWGRLKSTDTIFGLVGSRKMFVEFQTVKDVETFRKNRFRSKWKRQLQ